MRNKVVIVMAFKQVNQFMTKRNIGVGGNKLPPFVPIRALNMLVIGTIAVGDIVRHDDSNPLACVHAEQVVLQLLRVRLNVEGQRIELLVRIPDRPS